MAQVGCKLQVYLSSTWKDRGSIGKTAGSLGDCLLPKVQTVEGVATIGTDLFKRSRFKSLLWHLGPVWHWTNYLISLNLSFLWGKAFRSSSIAGRLRISHIKVLHKWEFHLNCTQQRINVLLLRARDVPLSVVSSISFQPLVLYFNPAWQIDGETGETVADFIFGGLQNHCRLLTAAMKLKDACSLEEKFWPT